MNCPEDTQLCLDFEDKKDIIEAMNADDLLAKGICHMRDQNTLAALSLFEKAFQLRKTPVIQSYFGACIALERGQINEAFLLCQEALEQDPGNPVCYLNLGKVYLKAEKNSTRSLFFAKASRMETAPRSDRFSTSWGYARNRCFPSSPGPTS